MKNKSVRKQVSPKTLMGIDIANQTHWLQMMYEDELIGKPFSIHNSKAGFENLVETIQSLIHRLGAHSAVVGMEPTG